MKLVVRLLRLASTSAFVATSVVSIAADAQPRAPGAPAAPRAPAVQAPRAAAQAAAGARAAGAARRADAQAHGEQAAPRRGAPARATKAAAVAPAAAVKVDPAALREAATAWAKEHGLPVREIEVGPPDRRVTRLFVPVTAEAWPSFVETFSRGPDRLMLKLKGDDNHLQPILDGASRLWARPVNWADRRYDVPGMANDNPNGPAMIVALSEHETRHVRQWFTHRAEPTDTLWGQACGHACMDYIGNIELANAADGTHTLKPFTREAVYQAAGANAQNVKGGVSVKVPTGTKLFDVLGIARSKDGRNMTYNMIHAASDRIAVVGIPVGSDQGGGQTEQRVIRENGRVFIREVAIGGAAVERFNNMTDEQLLGPPPPQGVAGVVRPVQP